jgi:hypothetical protein
LRERREGTTTYTYGTSKCSYLVYSLYYPLIVCARDQPSRLGDGINLLACGLLRSFACCFLHPTWIGAGSLRELIQYLYFKWLRPLFGSCAFLISFYGRTFLPSAFPAFLSEPVGFRSSFDFSALLSGSEAFALHLPFCLRS